MGFVERCDVALHGVDEAEVPRRAAGLRAAPARTSKDQRMPPRRRRRL